jgi:diguanylate cyclase (GGDEF)-like protein
MYSNHQKKDFKVILDTVSQQNFNSKQLKIMSQAILRRSILLIQILQSDDSFLNDELSLELRSLATQYVVAKQELTKQDLDPRLRILLDKLGPLNSNNGPIQYKVYDLVVNEERVEAADLFANVALPNQRKIFRVIKEMEDLQLHIAKNNIQAVKVNSYAVQKTLNDLNVLSIFFSILLTMFIITRQRASDTKLAYQASTDKLTNLPNRTSFVQLTNHHISNNPSNTFAVVFFDIDYFKSINDNFGHEVGDEILRRCSSKISSIIAHEDILARFGGDEFVLLLRSTKTINETKNLISKISAALDTSYIIHNNEIFMSASIGASFYTPEASNTKALLKNADVAMYSAKTSGRNCFKFYSKETSNRMEKEHALSHALHTIIKNNNQNHELYIMYQPLLDIKTGTTSECEALIRWKDASGKHILPDEFIPLAEKSNLIEKINLIVINETCKQQKEWQLSGRESIRININLSGNKRIFTNLLNQLKRNIAEMDLCPTLFGIELTERTLNEISQETIEELDLLRQQGIKISIDDFGTNYSSLMNLKKLPITTLKIDKGFIDDLPEDKDNKALVKTIIALGHALDLDIVAEGVETMAQLKFLKEQGCNSIQGYLYQYPLANHNIPPLLKLAA